MWLPLKEYQKETLQRLAEYCTAARNRYDRGINRFERDAFEYVTGPRLLRPARLRERPLRLPAAADRRRQNAVGRARPGNHRQ